MLPSAEGTLGAYKRRDGSRSRSRFDDDEMKLSIKWQSETAGFAPQTLLDRAGHGAFESSPKWSNIIELARARGKQIPVTIHLLIGVYAERKLGHSRRRDPLIENWRIVSAMHMTGW
jgi:hypothetical protein